MTNALAEAASLGLDCVQVFTKNQQQWTAPALKAEAVAAWLDGLRSAGWGEEGRVVSHASYLANMASPDSVLREKSIGLMREEIERCEALAIRLLVFHPGAHTSDTREAGAERVAEACARLLRETAGYRCVLCLENVAGAGTTIGRTFEELAELRARAIELGAPAERVGFCIDTCHAHAAGYDLSTPAGVREALDRLGSTLGFEYVRALHLNDSKGAAGSRLDRHEHIGRGTIGPAGFGAFLACPAWAGKPKIMETPKGENDQGVAWDRVNLERLHELAGSKAPAGVAQPAGTAPVRTTQPRPTRAARKNAAAGGDRGAAKGGGRAKGSASASKPQGGKPAKGRGGARGRG
jgi:deoxyribonuclease-4